MTQKEVQAEFLLEAMPYIEKYQNKVLVIKYGGNAMVSEELKKSVMRDLTLLRFVGINVVLVHGGGPEISETLKRMGVESRFVNGLRYTDEETAEVVRMVLAGKVNKELVHRLQMLGAKSVGMCGIDGGMLLCEKESDELGYVGKIVSVNTDVITDSLQNGYLPVKRQCRYGSFRHRGGARGGEPHPDDGHPRPSPRQGRRGEPHQEGVRLRYPFPRQRGRHLGGHDPQDQLLQRSDPPRRWPCVHHRRQGQAFHFARIALRRGHGHHVCKGRLNKGSIAQQLENTYMAETFSRFPVAIERGEGATLFDTEGKRYVDFGSGIAVNIFGANDEKWKAAVIDQLSRIQHVSNYYYSEPQLDLAELLCFRTGAKRVFFANSGAEANECALKAARKYSFEKYGEGRKKIISLNGSFHGRTLFTLTATGQQAFHRFFGPFVPEVVSVDANMQAVEKESENACAVIIECVQGESGVEALDQGFVRALRAFRAATAGRANSAPMNITASRPTS